MKKIVLYLILLMTMMLAVSADKVCYDSTYPGVSGFNVNTVDYNWGSASWENDPGESYFEFYMNISPLGTFTIGDIEKISFTTKKPGLESDVDFFVKVYTAPDDVDDYGWYGYRLNGEPYYSENLNAPSNVWNLWTTDSGINQLTFFDTFKTNGGYGFYGQPTWQEIQAGVNWNDYNPAYPDQLINYSLETVLYMAIGTGSGWNSAFTGVLDSVIIELKSGDILEIDLEETCNCDYTEWQDQECVNTGKKGYRRQTRDELSGYITCTEPLEQEVRDATCNCDYSPWQDVECVKDGKMLQSRTEATNQEWCTRLSRKKTNPVCDCTLLEVGRTCVREGAADVMYDYNYDYCGLGIIRTEGDENCACTALESSRECVAQDTAEVTYEYNHDYCDDPYKENVSDETCECDYTEWIDSECVLNGKRQQTRNELSGYPWCTRLTRNIDDSACTCRLTESNRICIREGAAEVTYEYNYDYCGEDLVRVEGDSNCNCVASESSRECVDNELAEVTYEYNYDYCDAAYQQNETDLTCVCDYTPWQNEECAADGKMGQIRQELSGYSWCTARLERQVDNTECDCFASEISRECIANELAEVTYEYNHDYCDEDYTQEESDLTCVCDYTSWENIECVADGKIFQTRQELSEYPWCTARLERQRNKAECDCVASEIDRMCVDDGVADVTFSYNYDYCEEDFSLEESDAECLCYGDWRKVYCMSNGNALFLRNLNNYQHYCGRISIFKMEPDPSCGLADSDKDGVPNNDDQCPYSYSRDEVDENGCSARQFCSQFRGTDCEDADWLDNEAGSPEDCYIKNSRFYYWRGSCSATRTAN